MLLGRGIRCNKFAEACLTRIIEVLFGGQKETRTPDLHSVNVAL